MATIQVSLHAPSRLSSLNAVSTSNSVPSSTKVECKAWGTSQRRSLTIRATSSGEGRSAAPSGVGGNQVPLGGGVTTAPSPQKGVPKAERIAYVCSACGYIYDLDTPWEEQPESYNCPVCKAPKDQFVTSNATLGEGVFDVTKGEDAQS